MLTIFLIHFLPYLSLYRSSWSLNLATTNSNLGEIEENRQAINKRMQDVCKGFDLGLMVEKKTHEYSGFLDSLTLKIFD